MSDTSENTIAACRRAIEAAPADSPQQDALYHNLALALRARYSRGGWLEDLVAAIEAYRQAIAATPAASDDRAGRMGGLSNALRARYSHTGAVEDLDEALALGRDAVELTLPDAAARAGRLNNLAICLRLRYLRQGVLDDLTATIAAFAEVLALLPADSPDRAGCTSNYALCLLDRYGRRGAEQDLEEAIAALRRVLDSCPDDSRFAGNLGSSLLHRYARAGQREDLEQAVTLLERAVARTPEHNPDLMRFLSSLSHAYISRYGLGGKLDDLDRAVHSAQRSVELTPDHAPDLSLRLNNLGSAYRFRYLRSRSKQDLELAIDIFRTMVRLTAREAPNCSGYLANLGNCLQDRFMDGGAADDLDQAIAAYQEAVHYSPEESPHTRSILSNLGNGLRMRFRLRRQVRDLDLCIEIYEWAIAHAPSGSVEQAGYYNNLAAALGMRYLEKERDDDFAAVLATYRRAADLGRDTDTQTYLTTLNNWIRPAFAAGKWPEVEEIHARFQEAAARLVHSQLLREHQESWLRDIQGIAARAAYALARLDKLEQAVMALETGQARLLSESLARDRADLERLRRGGHDALYQRYRQEVEQLRHLTRLAAGAEPGGNTREQLRAAYARFDATVAAVREVEPDFLRPPDFATVRQAADSAPLLYLAATELGGLALCVRSDCPPTAQRHHGEVQVHWLPGLAEEVLRDIVQTYLDAYRTWRDGGSGAFATWREALDHTTRRLWGCVFAPLRDRLPAAMVLIPTGLLALLPLHAAWTPDETAPDGRRYALDLWRIRYAPNARAVAEAVRLAGGPAQSRGSDRLLAVDEPDNGADPQVAPLVHSAEEVRIVCAGFRDATVLAGAQATRAAVLEAAPRSGVLHFSCHGQSDPEQPLLSALLMAGGERLTLQDFLDTRLHARLAVLSACETGVPGSRLPDEVVSLAAGLLQAGAAGVVSSLWAVSDAGTMHLMRRFYALWRGECADDPAEALRRAQQWLRERSREEIERAEDATRLVRRRTVPAREAGERPFAHPFYWAAFTYIGV